MQKYSSEDRLTQVFVTMGTIGTGMLMIAALTAHNIPHRGLLCALSVVSLSVGVIRLMYSR